MNTQKLISGLLAIAACIGLTVVVAQAQILPVDPTAHLVPVASPVTVSLFQGDRNVTGTWLPEPDQPVKIVVVGLPPGTTPDISLVCPDGTTIVKAVVFCPTVISITPDTNPFLNKVTGFAGTSAYPGVCTNSGSPTDFSPDYEFDGIDTLTPRDCGGLAVIRVNPGNLLFLLPAQGPDPNGIPQIWKDVFCPANSCPTGKEDLDAGPVAGSAIGDGIFAFDEFRGFKVSGVHVRLDPRQRDVFLHLMNPGCTSDLGVSLLGGSGTTYPTPTSPAATLTLSATSGGGVVFTTSVAVFSTAHARGQISAGTGQATIVSVMSPTSVVVDITRLFDAPSKLSGFWQLRESLFANLYTLLSPERVHLLGYTPFAANSTTGEWVDKFSSLVPPQTFNSSDGVSDRIVNPNRLYGPPQKGVRLLDCQDTSNADRLGWSYGTGSPNSVGDLGNIIVYTQRTVNNIMGLLAALGTVKYFTFANGAFTTPTPVLDGIATNPAVANFLISKVIQYLVAMEVGHVFALTPTVMGTNKTSYGTHYCPGCGDALDQTFTNKFRSGVNTFFIPSVYGGADQKDFLIK